MATKKITLTNEDADILHPVTEISAVENLNVNGANLGNVSTLNIFAPTTPGQPGKVLKSAGSGEPQWADIAGLNSVAFNNVISVYGPSINANPEEETNWTTISGSNFSSSTIFYTHLGLVSIFSVRLKYDDGNNGKLEKDKWYVLKINNSYINTANTVLSNIPGGKVFTSKKFQNTDINDLAVYFMPGADIDSSFICNLLLFGSINVIEPVYTSFNLSLSINTDAFSGLVGVENNQYPRITESSSDSPRALVAGNNIVYNEEKVWCLPTARIGFTTPIVTSAGITLNAEGYGTITQNCSISITSTIAGNGELPGATLSRTMLFNKYLRIFAKRSPGLDISALYYKVWPNDESSTEPSEYNLHYFSGDSAEQIVEINKLKYFDATGVYFKCFVVSSSDHGLIQSEEFLFNS